jgi:hypothetical protein
VGSIPTPGTTLLGNRRVLRSKHVDLQRQKRPTDPVLSLQVVSTDQSNE